MDKNNRKQILIYIGASYGLFWGIFIIAIILIQTGVIPVNLNGESAFLNFLKILISWTPTMAVYFFRKQLFPGQSVKEIFLGMFREKLNMKLFTFVIALEVALNVLAGAVCAIYSGTSLFLQWKFSVPLLISSFTMSLFTGATGEESGWHGFLLPHFMKRWGCIRSSIGVGIIWGLWHIPLWLISGYTGLSLVLYILEFMICTVAWSVVMDILYCWNHNLLIVTTFHFFVNFLLCFFAGNDLVFQITIAVLYIITAVIFAIIYKKDPECCQIYPH